jgi:exopolysaccharide biosynthesis WecB/TagA/CpsF family protein
MTGAGRTEFLGIGFDVICAREARMRLLELAQSRSFSYLVTPNVDHVVQLHRRARGDPLWRAYAEAELCLCDSRILEALARRSHVTLTVVTGSDLTAELLDEISRTARSLAVVGGTGQMVQDLQVRFPNLRWHHHSPPMGVGSNPVARQEIVEFVERTAADITFLAIGAPQSELLCSALAQRNAARGVALCIGASLEFLTGAKARAPRWMQRARLEWLFRLLSEPRRLARRYLLNGPAIFTIWSRWKGQRRNA